jgi:hypothetical protein
MVNIHYIQRIANEFKNNMKENKSILKKIIKENETL